MMQDFTMVIPSYWGWRGAGADDGEQIVFDHPAMLDEEGTLGRLLDSLEVLGECDGTIVIISVANMKGIVEDVQAKVDAIIEPYRERYKIINMGLNALEGVKKRLEEKRVSAAALELINLDNYAAVRNMCSLAGILNSSRYTIFIDDDEVFTDPEFLKKVHEDMVREIDGQRVQALAGYYLQPDTYKLDDSKVPAWRRAYWNNAAVMNEAFEKYIGGGERLKVAPFVFGGNMTLTLEALKQVPFDPKITRGEDIDFLLNLRIHGIPFYLDRELAITHLPPGSDQPAWKKVKEDAVRFLYERKKVQDHAQLKLDELQPYPGTFLGDDLDERIVKTCELLKRDYIAKGELENACECDYIVEMVEKDLFGEFDTKVWLEKVSMKWGQLAEAADGIGIL
jgi:hypothetical protein